MPNIEDRQDQKRGCGWRSSGGKYFIGGMDGAAKSCGRFPLALHICPTCNQGIKPTRGFTWFNPIPLIESQYMIDREDINCLTCEGFGQLSQDDQKAKCIDCEGFGFEAHLSHCEEKICSRCPLGGAAPLKAGLLWIGEKFYRTPEDFLKEASAQGISRRIAQVPKDFIVGAHWLFLAHRKAIYGGRDDFGDEQYTPGVFFAFKPTHIEYVVSGKESEKELEQMEKRGLTLVRITKEKLLDEVLEGANK